MGRPKLNNVPLTIKVNKETLDLVDARLFDPFTGSAQHGAKSRLIDMLLRLWLNDPSVVGNPMIDKGADDPALTKLAAEAAEMSLPDNVRLLKMLEKGDTSSAINHLKKIQKEHL